jgi:predicted dehydrogenase
VPFSPPPKAHGSYEALLADSNVDAVYIPLPTGMRTEWVIRAAKAKKHVLVEKPVGVTTADVEKILAACEQNDVQFMDGVMFMHTERLSKLRETLNDGQSVGAVRRIVAHFSFRGGEDFAEKNIRVSKELEPLGCLGDLGWYTIRLALWTMNYQMPISVVGRMNQEINGGVPTEFSAELVFPDNVTASLYCSFLTENQQWANISGTKGYIHLRDYVLPYTGNHLDFDVVNSVYQRIGCDFNSHPGIRTVSVPEHANSAHSAQETNMIRTFADLVLTGRIDPSWGQITLKTQRVLDACLQSARNGGVAAPV